MEEIETQCGEREDTEGQRIRHEHPPEVKSRVSSDPEHVSFGTNNVQLPSCLQLAILCS